MMSKLTAFSVFILILVLLSGCGKNKENDFVKWQRAFGYDDFDAAYSVMAVTGGKFILAGETRPKGGKSDILLVKMDSAGTILGMAAYGGSGDDIGRRVIPAADGNYLVVGVATDKKSIRNTFIMKIDTLGNQVWRKTYGDTLRLEAWNADITVDGGLVITGSFYSEQHRHYDLFIMKTDQNGDSLWLKSFGGLDDDIGRSIIQTSDGGYAVCGWTKSFGAGVADIYLLKTNADGDSIWAKTFGGEEYDGGNDIIQIDDHGYLVTGRSHSFGTNPGQVYVVKTDNNGDSLWTRVYDSGHNGGEGYSLIPTDDGNYLILGSYNAFDPDKNKHINNINLLKIDQTGNVLAGHKIGGDVEDLGYDIIPVPDGGYLIVGRTLSFQSHSEAYVVKTGPL
jgi:hypothetical protein